jgi:hypothetical protein
MATIYMRDVSTQTHQERVLCCTVLNRDETGGPEATPTNLELFSVAAVRAALVRCYPELSLLGQRLAEGILGDLSGADGEPVPAVGGQ